MFDDPAIPIKSCEYQPIQGNNVLRAAEDRYNSTLIIQFRFTEDMDFNFRGNDIDVLSKTLTTSFKKFLRVNSCLFQDRSQCSFRQIPWVIRYGSITTCGRTEPDLVASGSLAVKAESK